MRRLSGGREHLDGPLHPALLAGNMRDLVRINRWFGGIALSRRALISLSQRKGALSLLDVGTGAADIPTELISWFGRRGLTLQVEATDTRREILDIASGRVGDRPDLHLSSTPGDHLVYDHDSFDIVHASLLLHHLEPADARKILGKMARVARHGVIVNDLGRSRLAWAGAWLLTRLITRNRYTRHDAPLSVRRAYQPDEVARMAREAGLVEVARFRGFLGHRYAMAFVRSQSKGPT